MKSRSRSSSRKRSIPPLRSGELKQFGYSINLPQDERRVALKRAVKAYPVVSIMRKLNALYVFQKNRYPVNANKFKSDEKWLKSSFYEPNVHVQTPVFKLRRISGKKACWRRGSNCRFVKSKTKSSRRKNSRRKSK